MKTLQRNWISDDTYFNANLSALIKEKKILLNIAICDDEAFFRDWIKEMLLQYMKDKGVVYEIDTFPSAKELLNLGIEMNQYEIIFLDINMDNIDGLMAARKIREQNKGGKNI